MKQVITRIICAILLSPILTIMLIGYIPFAIFKGLTDNFVFDEYFNFVERITDFLLSPVTRWQDRKNRYEELKRTSEWYRKENKRLNDILDKESEKQTTMTREQIKIALPLILAFAEGKTIQIKNRSRWIDIDGDKDELNLDSVVAYRDCFRIKPNDVYLPSATPKNSGRKYSSTPPST